MEANTHFNNLKKFDMVKNFQPYPYEIETDNLLQSPHDAKIPHSEPTRQCQLEPEVQQFEPRSTKRAVEDLGISFQACFMDEHKKCFLNQTQKYVELQKVLLQNSTEKDQFLKKSIYHEIEDFIQYDQYSIKSFLKQNCTLLEKNEVSRLYIDLKRQDKLEEFLTFVINQAEEKYASEFLYIGNQIMEAYFQVQDQGYTLEEIIQLSQGLIQKYAKAWDQKLSYINFKGSTLQNGKKCIQRFNLFKKFIEVYALTILLVMGGFFQNPAFELQSNYLKRQLDCDRILSDYDEEDIENATYRKTIQKRIKY